MLRMKRQRHKGTGRQEHPQRIVQKPTSSQAEWGVWGVVKHSIRSPAHVMPQRQAWSGQERLPKTSSPAPSTTCTKGAEEPSQNWPTSRATGRRMTRHHSCLSWVAQPAGPLTLWTEHAKTLIDCLLQMALLCVLKCSSFESFHVIQLFSKVWDCPFLGQSLVPASEWQWNYGGQSSQYPQHCSHTNERKECYADPASLEPLCRSSMVMHPRLLAGQTVTRWRRLLSLHHTVSVSGLDTCPLLCSFLSTRLFVTFSFCHFCLAVSIH